MDVGDDLYSHGADANTSAYPERRMRRILVFTAVLMFAATGCSVPASQGPRARVLEGQVWSPYCPGRLLTECTTRQANELRAEIATRVRNGESDTQILDWLRSDFGDAVLAKPAADSRGRIIWLVPLAAFLAGVIIVAGLVWRWSRLRTTAAPATQHLPIEVKVIEQQEWIEKVRERVRRND